MLERDKRREEAHLKESRKEGWVWEPGGERVANRGLRQKGCVSGENTVRGAPHPQGSFPCEHDGS